MVDDLNRTPVLVGDSLKYPDHTIHPNIGLTDRVQLHQGVKDGYVDGVGLNLIVNSIDRGVIGLHVHVPLRHTQFELARCRQKEPALQFCHVQIVALTDSRDPAVQLFHIVVAAMIPNAAALAGWFT